MQEGICFGGPVCFHNADISALPPLVQLQQWLLPIQWISVCLCVCERASVCVHVGEPLYMCVYMCVLLGLREECLLLSLPIQPGGCRQWI